MPRKAEVVRPQRYVKKNDAALTLAAYDILHAFIHAEYNQDDPAGLVEQKIALKGNVQDAIEALEQRASTSQVGVIETMWLAAQQVRALVDSK
jgi:hypothetical protein